MSAAATARIRSQVESALALREAGQLDEALEALATPGEYSPDFYTVRGEIQLALGRCQEAAGSYYTVLVGRIPEIRMRDSVWLRASSIWADGARLSRGSKPCWTWSRIWMTPAWRWERVCCI